jgi:hypothetical protein
MRAAAFSLVVTLAGIGLLFACSSDDNPTPTVTPEPDAQGPNGDASTCMTGNCNACTTPADDPYNACTAAAGGCVPFDNDTRVPRGPDGQIPKVP